VASERPLEVAIDLTQIDNQDLGSGQFRYAVDLANGLAAFAPEIHVTLIGTTAAAKREFAPALERTGRVRYVTLQRCRGVGAFYRDVLKLSGFLAANRIDVLHQMHTKVPFPKPCPVVATGYHYQYDAPLFESRPYRYYRWALRRAVDLVITLSDSTRDDFQRHFGVPANRMQTVYPGLSPSMAVGSGKRSEAPYLLSPYNLGRTKNLRSLVLAWPAIADRHPDLELVLYGNAQVTPEREADFNALFGSTPHARRIRRTGHIEDANLADLFAGCALFVFPTTVEGFGYPLLEAMHHGACCITRNASAMKEVGAEAVCLVETLNPDEIAGAAIALLNDSRRRAELGARAAARARRFTIEEMVGRTVECYRSVTL
jgi:glycosyltransferase involved in cell wall biosynthesis